MLVQPKVGMITGFVHVLTQIACITKKGKREGGVVIAEQGFEYAIQM